MIASLVRVLSFLLPIPFIALFFIKTDKFDVFRKYAVLIFFVPIFAQILFTDIGYNLGLISAYIAFTLFGASVFNDRGWKYSQALSLSFCLVYFGSFFWELPYHIYTIIINGGIDGAFPLHLLYIFPMVFVYEKIKSNSSKQDILIILSGILLISTLGMGILLGLNLDIWNVLNNTQIERVLEETLWMITRLVTMFGLFAIYTKSSLRKGVRKT